MLTSVWPERRLKMQRQHPSNTSSFKSEEEQMKTTKQKFASVGALALMVALSGLAPVVAARWALPSVSVPVSPLNRKR
jgi:hypothetical protein